MATIILETGAGNDPTANSYVDLAGCTAYHDEMGNTAWAAAAASPDDARITAIIRASRAIDRMYGRKFIGAPVNYGVQAMEWPRTGAVVVMDNHPSLEYGLLGAAISDDIVPPEIKKAVYEAALLELASPGSLTPNLDRGGAVKEVKAGSVAVTFSDAAPALTKYTALEGILRPLLRIAGTDLQLG